MSDSVPEAESKFAMSPPLLTVSSAIRPSDEDDVTSITAIYAHYVLHGLASFEIVPRAKVTCASGASKSSAKAFPILWPSMRVTSSATPTHLPTDRATARTR